MEKICFFDLKNDGHHWNYNINVIKSKLNSNKKCIYYTSNIDEEKQKILNDLDVELVLYKERNTILLLDNFISLLKLITFCKKNNIDELYILHLDPFVIQLSLLKKLLKNKIVTTLHWYPNKKIKEKFLQNLKDKVLIVVHTEEIKNKLQGKCILINYPNFEEEDVIYKKNDNKELTFLYFGALRLDKGVDILLESIKYVKNDFKLIIAGKESAFSKKFVEDKVKHFNNNNLILDINYISDKKMKEYYNLCDVVVLPYREHFLGESGVLIDAITKGKVIISTPISNAKEIVNKYNNGEIFNFEDYKMLSKKIDEVIDKFDFYNKNSVKACRIFNKIHSLEKFIESYKNI